MSERKSLDEVIEAFEICSSETGGCTGCPYCAEGKDSLESCERFDKSRLFEDEIYYLKKYRDTVEELEISKEYFNEWSAFFEKLMSEQPLTWDELKQMQGKPVWVEILREKNGKEYFEGSWHIINSIMDNFSSRESCYMDPPEGLLSASYGDTWNAYVSEPKMKQSELL